MFLHPAQYCDMEPSLGQITGSKIDRSVFNSINSAFSQGQVIFGQPGDPYREHYANLMNVVNTLEYCTDTLTNIMNDYTAPVSNYTLINSEELLQNIPQNMKLPILTDPYINYMFMHKQIGGWDYNRNCMPTEDVYGRLINNGRVVITAEDYRNNTVPKEFVWEYASTDPEISEKELDIIEDSRRWVTKWIDKEMTDDGKWRDPTDFTSRIRQLKNKK